MHTRGNRGPGEDWADSEHGQSGASRRLAVRGNNGWQEPDAGDDRPDDSGDIDQAALRARAIDMIERRQYLQRGRVTAGVLIGLAGGVFLADMHNSIAAALLAASAIVMLCLR